MRAKWRIELEKQLERAVHHVSFYGCSTGWLRKFLDVLKSELQWTILKCASARW
jgi:hypothetical protein